MRLLSWNVAARVKKQHLQLEAILDRDPDLIALQEVTPKTAKMWRSGLTDAGFEHILTSFDVFPEPDILVGARARCLLIASRWPLAPLDQTSLEMPWKERLLSVKVRHPLLEFELHSAYIPPGAPHGWLKIETFEGIYNHLAHRSKIPRILCGDFNSPKQELPDGRTLLWGNYLADDGTIQMSDDHRWAMGEKLVICNLAEYDLPDIYRHLNGWGAEDYSFVIWRKGKIVSQRRFDHVFASKKLKPVSCRYNHEIRETWLSDHSAVEMDFSPESKYNKIDKQFEDYRKK